MRSAQQFVFTNENGAPGEIRTPDPLVRSQVLYPTELRALWQARNYPGRRAAVSTEPRPAAAAQYLRGV
jgi:hypothetical protein